MIQLTEKLKRIYLLIVRITKDLDTRLMLSYPRISNNTFKPWFLNLLFYSSFFNDIRYCLYIKIIIHIYILMGCCDSKEIDQSEDTRTIYEQLGGEKAIEAAVEIFYKKVLSDPDLMEFFAETNMTFQKKHQKNFLTYLTGGAPKYEGKNMRDAHRHLKIKNEHFNAVVNHLVSTLRELGVSNKLIQKIGVAVESNRKDVLNL
jgi:hemoglobin